MAGILVSYDQFLEIRERRRRVAVAIDEQPIATPLVSEGRTPGDTPGDPRVRVEGGLVTND